MTDFSSEEAMRHFLSKWEAEHNIDVEAKSTADLDTTYYADEGTTYWEKELVRSYEKEIRVISYEFNKTEGQLFKQFQENEVVLEAKEKEYNRLRQSVGDRDPEVFFPPILLLAVGIIFFGALTLTNESLVKPIFSIVVLNWSVSALSAFVNTVIGYFIGRLLRQYGLKHRLIFLSAVAFTCHFGIFFLILKNANYGLQETLITIANAILLILMVILSHLAVDKEPHYPRIKMEFDALVKNRFNIVSERLNNFNTCLQAQQLLQSSAMKLRDGYRKKLHALSPSNLMKESKQVDFNLVELQYHAAERLKEISGISLAET